MIKGTNRKLPLSIIRSRSEVSSKTFGTQRREEVTFLEGLENAPQRK
jgi:hypothetical protein